MSTPGIDIRPLREITGEAVFNEVFLDGVVAELMRQVGATEESMRARHATLE